PTALPRQRQHRKPRHRPTAAEPLLPPRARETTPYAHTPRRPTGDGDATPIARTVMRAVLGL
ncbi:hypothetical protein ACIREM_17180, partial [Streptomyces shenzhenensis]|uniref:hypothetical protein n=1 Tax=Streptomyces shenzhenensis TaxID=943815 RepID=UPI003802B833